MDSHKQEELVLSAVTYQNGMILICRQWWLWVGLMCSCGSNDIAMGLPPLLPGVSLSPSAQNSVSIPTQSIPTQSTLPIPTQSTLPIPTQSTLPITPTIDAIPKSRDDECLFPPQPSNTYLPGSIEPTLQLIPSFLLSLCYHISSIPAGTFSCIRF